MDGWIHSFIHSLIWSGHGELSRSGPPVRVARLPTLGRGDWVSTVARRFQRFVWLGRRQRTIGPASLAHPRRLRLQRQRPGPHIHSFSPILALLAHSSSLVTTVPYCCPVCLSFLRLCAYPLSLLRTSSLSFLRSIHSLIPTTFTPHPPSLPAWHCCYSTLRTTTVSIHKTNAQPNHNPPPTTATIGTFAFPQ